MQIVILGANGFIGTHLATRLVQEGHTVSTVSRGVAPPGLAPRICHVMSTIDDHRALDPLLKTADCVVHLAWDTTPGTSQLQPTLEGTNNLLPTFRLIEHLQSYPRCRLVFVSSGGAIFINDAQTPFPEQAQITPRSYYGAAKAATELVLSAYHAQTGNSVAIVRPPNIYGPGQQAKRLFGIVPTLMRCVRDRTPFEIWGDGNTVRDYLYIDDFEDFILRLLTLEIPANSFEVFNVGSGRGVSINELCDAVEATAGIPLQREYRRARKVDTPFVVLDSTKARTMLGWVPNTSMQHGLEATWNWFIAQP